MLDKIGKKPEDLSWKDLPQAVQEAFWDDLNTPLVITHWQALCKKMAQQTQWVAQDIRALAAIHQFLGIGQQAAKIWFQAQGRVLIRLKKLRQHLRSANKPARKKILFVLTH